jgi:hypothetical protein
VCGVPVAPIEDADHVVVYGGKGLEEADKSMFVIDLLVGCTGQQPENADRGKGRERERGKEGPERKRAQLNSPLIPAGKTSWRLLWLKMYCKIQSMVTSHVVERRQRDTAWGLRQLQPDTTIPVCGCWETRFN